MEIQNTQFALINFDNTNLLIPQSEVSAIEMITIVETNTIGNSDNYDNKTIGQFETDSGSWPVFSISANFTARNTKRDSDRYCVCFQNQQQGQFGLMCSAVSSFQFEEENTFPEAIPEMMQLPESPIDKLIYYQSCFYLMSNVNKMYQYLVEV
ncbi:MAG: hypothetical protein ACC653_12420 [Gammaproteobacteria bacterium]